MNQTGLKYFMEVARTGSASAASASLHVAVSAISRQIARLESEVGAALFERVARGMVLTEAGQLLLAHGRRMSLEAEAVRASITALHEAASGRIRVSCSQGLATEVVPAALADFRARHPGVRFHVNVAVASDVSRMVAEGEVDVAIAYSLESGEGVEVRHVQRAPMYAVLSANHPLAAQERVTLEDLRAYPVAVAHDTTTRALFDRACNLAGLMIEPVYSCNHGSALYAFVRDSDALLLASYPSVAARLEREALVARPVESIEMLSRSLQVQVMAGRLLPPMIETFVAEMIARLKTYDVPLDAVAVR